MTGSAKPLISVVIPTRERAETLLFTLKTVLNQESRNFEVIVGDNFSQDATRTVVQSFADARLRYFNTGRRLSMCDNWDFALERARGEYVIIIGDDDGVMPEGIDRLEKFMLAHPSPVYTWPKHVYIWPVDGRSAFLELFAGVTSPSDLDLEKRARFVVRMGGWRCLTIPCMYHSAIARQIPDKIRQMTGRVFHSTSPDVFTSLAVPAFVSQGINLGCCVTLHGISRKANSGARRAEYRVMNQAKFMQEYGDYKVHPTLFPGVDIKLNLTPDSLLVAMDKFPHFYGKMKFNYDAMWAAVWREAPLYKLPLSRWDIIQKRYDIRRYHPFSVSRFLFFTGIQEAADVRRQLVGRARKRGPFGERAPNNISDFVKELAKMERKTLHAANSEGG